MSWHDLETLQGTSEITNTELFHFSVRKQRPQFTFTCQRSQCWLAVGSEPIPPSNSHPAVLPPLQAGRTHCLGPSTGCCLLVSAFPLLVQAALAKNEDAPLLPVHLPLPLYPIATAREVGRLEPSPWNQRFYSTAPFSASQCPYPGFCSPRCMREAQTKLTTGRKSS